MLSKIIEWILSLFKKPDPVVPPVIEPVVPEVEELPVVEEEPEVEEPEVEEPVTPPVVEVYTKYTVKEYQKAFTDLGLYDKGIDGIVGTGSKNATYIFNVTFLKSKSETYSENTDKKLKEIYSEYKKSKYMNSTLWKYTPNFKESEFKCKCNGKYCNGFNTRGVTYKIPFRMVMTLQFIRNYYGKAVYITSGFRCIEHNENEGGSDNSKHTYMKADDFYSEPTTANTILTLVKSTRRIPCINYGYKLQNYVYIVHLDYTI